MLASGNLDLPIRIATVVVPVALYFLILGLLNSRRHPQLLSGRYDFALLIAALGPLFVLPILHYVGMTVLSVAAACGALAGGIALLAPGGHRWVIYNVLPNEASNAVAKTLRHLGLSVQAGPAGFELPDEDAYVHVTAFPLLRNVSVRLCGVDAALADAFRQHLGRSLQAMPAESSPTAIALLVVATAMMVGPLAMVAHRAGEIVRILNDLLN